jgi:oxygen-independent coproporphyrinogen-3 oxidase
VPPFSTVFFGGGTPSLFTDEYAALFALIERHVAPDAEITLEANPDDVTPERLRTWRALGVNRLSLGVQTFAPRGLRALKRIHDADGAARAIDLALAAMPTVNADLIYGWTGDGRAQTPDEWDQDLARAAALGLPHMSLYTLTFEPRTPLGRAVHRGLTAPLPDDDVASMFELACARMAAAGLEHEEVSNWARPGHTCRHNWGYWSDQPYLGVGAGAHGYLRDPDGGPGLRYAYPRDDRRFLRSAPAIATAVTPAALEAALGVEVEPARTLETWLMDYVGSALRTSRGLDLALISARTGATLRPTPRLAAGFAEGMAIQGDRTLRLAAREWFRETAWALEVLGSLASAATAR